MKRCADRQVDRPAQTDRRVAARGDTPRSLLLHRMVDSTRESFAGFFLGRRAGAHSCGCKSRHKLITASEAKRNCARVTERGEEAWSEAASR